MQLFSRITLIFFAGFLFTGLVTAQNISTFAGSGYNGNIGNGGPAVNAGIPYPRGISFDGNNYMYLTCSNAIRKINFSTGIITNVAGSDTYGYTGDGGLAINALLQNPIAVCVDSVNKILYIVEYSGHRIRKIDLSSGIITTFAGTGTAGYSGDGGAAINARFDTPHSLCLDYNGNLYVADCYNSRIRRINIATGIISTFAGTGSPNYSGDGGPAVNAGVPYPTSVSSDGAGNIFFTEVRSGNTSRVRKITAATGIISTVAGNNNYAHSGDGGLAVNASLFDPSFVIIDRQNNIYISQYDDSRIRKVDATTGIINTIAGTGTNGYSGDGGPATLAMLHYPFGLTLDNSNNLYFADNFNHRIRSFNVCGAAGPPPAISITSSGTNVCGNPTITFSANASNAGPSPVYQWKKNNVNAGINSSTYTASGFVNGDQVTCEVSVVVCANLVNAGSNIITLTAVNTQPSIIIATPVTTICTGINTSFTATASNCGNLPSYQWKINSLNTGTNANSFTTATLLNGDVVSCVVTVDPLYVCTGSATAISNTLVMTVNGSGVQPTVSVTTANTSICPGTKVTVIANTQNLPANTAIEWWLNGSLIAQNSNSYSTSTLTGNNQVYCKIIPPLTSCFNQPVTSNILNIMVVSVPVISITPVDTVIGSSGQVQFHTSISGNNNLSSFSWQPANKLINAGLLSPRTVALDQTTEFFFSGLSAAGCNVSSKTKVIVNNTFFLPNSFTPNDDNLNDIFRIPPGTSITLLSFLIYDRWGRLIFYTTDKNKGWDGKEQGRKKDTGAYSYMIKYMDGNKTIETNGSFLLIR